MATRDEILSLIKPYVYGWIEDVLGSSPSISSNLGAVSGGASGAAGGDLAGTYPNPTVDGLQGRAIDPAAPSSGQIYRWNGSLWLPGNISDIAGTITDSQHGSRAGGSLHAAATTSALGFVELATNGESAANVVVQGNDGRLSDARTPTGTAGGDLAGTYPNPTVDGLQGRAVVSTAPSAGQVYQWSSGSSQWTPGGLGAVKGVRCIAQRTTSLTLAGLNDITWNSEVIDEGGWFTAPGTTFTLPTGVYVIAAHVDSGGAPVSSQAIGLVISGAPQVLRDYRYYTSGSGRVAQSIAGIVAVTDASDSITIQLDGSLTFSTATVAIVALGQ